jgi:Fuc2NAc and GlcNAc transferase
MDGINGFAAVNALVFCVGVQVLARGIPGWVGDLTWLLAGSVIGLLVYTWPPAKVVMGNVGSALLGLLLAVLTLQLWRGELLPLVACLILLAGLWFDATYTLCVKMRRGQSFADAFSHTLRGHLYQHVAERRGQVWTIVGYMIFAVGWLLPLSWLTVLYTHLDLLWLVLAVLPMGIAAYVLNAGMPAPDEG